MINVNNPLNQETTNLTENDCDIKYLERKIDEMLKNSRYFKNETVTGKSLFDVQLLGVKIKSKAEHSRANQIGIMFLTILFSFVSLVILEGLGMNSLVTSVNFFLFIIIVLVSYFVLDARSRNTAELNSHGIELIKLLIEKKKKG